MTSSRTYLILTVVIIIAAGIAYSLKDYNDLTLKKQSLDNQGYIDSKIDSLNQSIISGQNKSNVRWNNTFGNLSLIQEAVSLLHSRTPLFENITYNEQVIIANQYEFAKQLNVTDISNESR